MSNGTEQIESRLAAYIDGELPESERAEIEKYLTANPGHRQLIEELRGHKRKLASLPRERAPADIMDHLQSHLERQVLLENVEAAAGALRINRWPQWSAIAAMLLLTTGLGVLVYAVLPGGALNREQIVIAPSSNNLPVAPDLDEKADRMEAAERDGAPKDDLLADAVRSRELARESGAIAGNADKRGEDFVDKAAAEMEAKGLMTAAAGVGAKEASPLALNNGSAIVVATDDPMITQNLLAGYLGQNSFEFHPVRSDVAQAAMSLGERMTLSPADSTNFNVISNTSILPPPQAIGSMVQRVNEKAKSTDTGEQYLVVRNLTPQDAEKLNLIINTQRGARQQARVFSNDELYPEYRRSQFEQQPNAAAQQPQQGGQQQLFPQQKYQQQAKQTDPGKIQSDGANQQTVAGTATGSDELKFSAAPPATTQPTSDADAKMDVLIVVRNEAPPAEAAPGVDAIAGLPDAVNKPAATPVIAEPAATQPTTVPTTHPATQPE